MSFSLNSLSLPAEEAFFIMTKLTTSQICEAVALDLKARKITHQKVADTIGTTKAVVSNIISGKKAFSKARAEQFAKAFHYNINFLLYGEGELRSDNVNYVVNPTVDYDSLDVSVLVAVLDVAEYLLHLTGDKTAIDAWNAMMKGDYKTYVKDVKLLQEKGLNTGRTHLVLAKYISERISKNLFPSMSTEKSYSEFSESEKEGEAGK